MMNRWIRSTRRPSRWRRLLARFGLVRQANLSGRPELEEFPKGAVRRATVDLPAPIDVVTLALALDNVDRRYERGWAPPQYARALASEYERIRLYGPEGLQDEGRRWLSGKECECPARNYGGGFHSAGCPNAEARPFA